MSMSARLLISTLTSATLALSPPAHVPLHGCTWDRQRQLTEEERVREDTQSFFGVSEKIEFLLYS